jgi:hypothetical protein
MNQNNEKNKKSEDGIKVLMKKYAEWKEKQELNKYNDFEQYLLEDQEFLDFDKEF